MPNPQPHLFHFYGTECVHCKEMDPLHERLEKEEGITLTHKECWHDATNAQLLEKYDQGQCGGVPFYYNTQTEKSICGNCDYETLKAWAKGL
jgi:thiol-disulfide isomerase/thioredoxin